MLRHSNFLRQAVKALLHSAGFAAGLFELRFASVQIAHHFGDGDDVAGIDLGLVLLRPVRPHGALDARGVTPRARPSPDQTHPPSPPSTP